MPFGLAQGEIVHAQSLQTTGMYIETGQCLRDSSTFGAFSPRLPGLPSDMQMSCVSLRGCQKRSVSVELK